MRVFVAIDISPKLQEKVFEWQKKYSRFPVRWLKSKNLHVTLVPPWETDDIGPVIEDLRGLEGKYGPQELVFRMVEFGPHKQDPQLVWAEGEMPVPLRELRTELEGMFGCGNGFQGWNMHLTLARFGPEDFQKFPSRYLSEEVEWCDRATSFVLLHSHPGSEYEVLTRVSL